MKNKILVMAVASWLAATHVIVAAAQQRHELIRGDLPPGQAANLFQLNDRSLIGHQQPVQLRVPGQTVVEVGSADGSFFGGQASQMSVMMAVGYVYRFKLSNFPLPGAEGRQLYPSIEVIGRLNPPAGLKNEFPIQVYVTPSDLQHAMDGRMVTRVIYLEDPRGAFTNRHDDSLQPSFDVSSNHDPLRAAEKLGRPMAILRMGSRVPLANDAQEWFNFGNGQPEILPTIDP